MRNKFIYIAILLMFSIFAHAVEIPLLPEGFRFKDKYPEVQRLLFNFDFGHARPYERLYLRKGEKIPDPFQLEEDFFKEILALLNGTDSSKAHEEDIAPNYVQHFKKVVDIFDWSHLLHQWLYDVLATSGDRGDGMAKRVQEIYEFYKTKPAITISEKCKSMQFMDSQLYSKSFRRKFLRYNFLIWVYHWFQIKLYDDLLLPTESERDQAVAKTTAEFWERISDLPDSAGFDMMPSMEEDAPKFTKLFPKIAATFDTNHMLHDIVSDILTSDMFITPKAMIDEGLRVANLVQDPLAYAKPLCPGEEKK